MKKIILGLMLFATMVVSSQGKVVKAEPAQAAPAPKETIFKFTGKIDKVTDGDTFRFVDFESGQKFIIRLAGVDAPEKKQEFGWEARNEIYKIFQEVDYVVTIEVISKDVYGRYVAWVYYGKEANVNLSETLLLRGFVWHFKEYDKSEYLQSLEDTARQDRKGLWKYDNPIYPSEFRKSQKRR